jgi:hypothetical protein
MAIIGLVLTIAAWVAWKEIRSRRLERAFSQIHVGQTQSEITQLLGRPTRMVGPLPSHWCDATPVAEQYASAEERRCTQQWQYDLAFVPACLSVCFDSGGQVDSTYKYVSP